MNIDFHKLEIYGLAKELVFSTYDLLECFPEHENNNLCSQLRRAVTCLPLNIAEGSGASSYKIFLNYLIFCYRSCMECEAALELAIGLGYITEEQHQLLFGRLDKFIRKLWRYMEYIESRTNDRKKDKSYYYRHQKYRVDNSMRERISHLS